MLRAVVRENPHCDGIVLGGHGLFTWGETQRESYLNTITMIDHLGQFIHTHMERKGSALFGGAVAAPRDNRRDLVSDLLPFVRGRVSQQKRLIVGYNDLPEVLRFVDSKDAAILAHLGTSCPDHFIRTKIRPLFVPAEPSDDLGTLQGKIDAALAHYRTEYAAYYQQHVEVTSPAMREPNPAVLLVPGLGMFSFGKSRTEARIVGEFYTNAIHVMEGATALAGDTLVTDFPQAGPAAPCSAFQAHANYVALPPSEAFRIEYWLLEDAKLRRQPAEKELSRRIALIVWGASGIGRAAALLAAERGAHIVIADRDLTGAEPPPRTSVLLPAKRPSPRPTSIFAAVTASSPLCEPPPPLYGGVDILINTAAVFPPSPAGSAGDSTWSSTLDLNMTANYVLADEAAKIFATQDLDGAIVLTSSANAVVPKRGSEAYDVSKAALSHLVRELAVSLAPKVRVNGISPATVVKGSTMFPATASSPHSPNTTLPSPPAPPTMSFATSSLLSTRNAPSPTSPLTRLTARRPFCSSPVRKPVAPPAISSPSMVDWPRPFSGEPPCSRRCRPWCRELSRLPPPLDAPRSPTRLHRSSVRQRPMVAWRIGPQPSTLRISLEPRPHLPRTRPWPPRLR